MLIRENKVEELEKWLSDNPDALLVDENGAPLLHIAATCGSLGAIDALLMAGHPWNAWDSEGKTAGERALEAKQAAAYDRLLEEGVRAELILGAMERNAGGKSQSHRTVLRPEDEFFAAKRKKSGTDAKEETSRGVRAMSVSEDAEEGKAKAEGAEEEAEAEDEASEIPNQVYLSSRLRYERVVPAAAEGTEGVASTATTATASPDGGLTMRLMDGNDDAVMSGWELPLMNRHAKLMCEGRPERKEGAAEGEGFSVLNVGFGLGLFDAAVQRYKPAKHVIIEAHPDVLAFMMESGWDKLPGVEIRAGRWQDVVPQLEAEGYQFDGIYTDTFGEYYAQLRDFFEYVPNLLKEGGHFSFFNGLGGTNPFFHDVYCKLTELELQQMGLSCRYERVDVDSALDKRDEDSIWAGVRRRYWSLPAYNLPIVRFGHEVEAEAEAAAAE